MDALSILVGGFTPLKHISHWEGLSHTLWEKKHVPNHQPDSKNIY